MTLRICPHQAFRNSCCNCSFLACGSMTNDIAVIGGRQSVTAYWETSRKLYVDVEWIVNCVT